MILRYVLSIWLMCLCCKLQADDLGRALKALQNKQYAQARQFLQKNLQKNPRQPLAKYAYSLYFQAEAPHARADSAYWYLLAALADWQQPEVARQYEKQARKLKLSPDSLQQHQRLLEKKAYLQARQRFDVEAFQFFTDTFREAPEWARAVEIRDSLAFEAARTEDSFEAYKAFLRRYPDSKQARDAERFRDLLVFEQETAGKSLAEYEAFLENYPQSKAREEAEKHIFDILAYTHSSEGYEQLFRRFGNSAAGQRALHWLHFLYQEQNQEGVFLKKFPQYIHKDKLQKLLPYNALDYLPVLINGRYGYGAANGELPIACQLDTIPQAHLCEPIQTSWLSFIVDGKLGVWDKLGQVLFEAQFDAVEDFGEGLLLVQKGKMQGLVHLGGFVAVPIQYEAIERLGGNLLKIKQEGRWGLSTVHHKWVEEAMYEEIDLLSQEWIRFRRDSLYGFLHRHYLLAKLAKRPSPPIYCQYSDIEDFEENYLLAEDLQGRRGLLYRDGNEALSFAFEDIRAVAGLWIAKNEEGHRLYTSKGKLLQEQIYEGYHASESLLALKKSGKWALFDKEGVMLYDFKYDSITFLRELIVLHQGRNTILEFPNQKRVSLPNIKSLQIIRSPSESKPYFLLVEQQNSKKGLYNIQGAVVLPTRYDRIYMLEKQLISVGIAQKNGLVDTLGRELVKMEYEGIGNMSEGFVPLLKDGKFGLFEPKTKLLLPPVYDLLPRSYAQLGGQAILIARKDGFWGFINAQNTQLSAFVYDEIRFWQDSMALVRHQNEWLFENYLLPDSLRASVIFDEIRILQEALGQKNTWIWTRSGEVQGVWHSLQGNVVPMQYRQIQTLGTAEYPLFVCEKNFEVGHIEMMSISYYNHRGKLLKKRLVREQDLARLQCPDEELP